MHGIYENSDTIPSLITYEDFVRVISEKFTKEEIYCLRMYDFEDVAIRFAYGNGDIRVEDVENNNFSSCYDY